MLDRAKLYDIYKKASIAGHFIDKAVDYLQKYGYLKESEFDLGDFLDAVEKFQDFYGFDQTGHLTTKELSVITNPCRCGVADIMAARTEEYRWKKTNLTYYVNGDIGDGISITQQKQVFAQAWKAWYDLTNISIREVDSRQADIIIGVGSGRRYQFDGPNGTLAWAHLPPGDDRQLQVFFDLDERWILSANQQGILLLNVATHEFGHILGLEHSKVKTALMAPYYSVNVSKPQLTDDIPRIQAIYGKKNTQPDPEPIPDPEQKEYIIRVKGVVSIDGHRINPIGT